ncbi:MAG TPA: carboxypeptidase regulatory-like domain-containing protein [Clostridia bacterium]|nr:carboxypeptidase regulatory-like domain-containing protein [Clostridia bacterium]
MKHAGRRFFALLMTLVMLLTMIPATVTANPGEPEVFIVAGRITDSVTKKGLSGATVRLSNTEKEYTDTTDAFGYYQIDAHEAGTYEISASLRGYSTVTDNNFELNGTKDWFAELTLDSDPCIDIYASVKCVYSGIALEGVEVRARHSSEGLFTELTDSDGSAVFYNLPKGKYTFEVNVNGQPGWENYISGEYDVTQDQLLNCSLKPKYQSLTVKTYGFCAFTEQENSPLRNVYVRLHGLDPTNHDVELISPAPIKTGEDGTVVFDKLVPIDWLIEVYSPGYEPEEAIVKAMPDGTFEQDTVRMNMVFHPGTLTANLDSLYDDEQIYYGLEVHLCGNDTITEGLTRTVTVKSWDKPKRVATFRNLLPGQYKVYTYGNCERYVQILVQDGNIYCDAAVNPSISPLRVFSVTFQGETQAVAKMGKKTEVELPLDVEKANYSGFLKKIDMDEEGTLKTSPAANTVMTLVPSEYYPQNPEKGQTYTVTTDEFGYYSFNVYPGLYGVTVSGMDDYWGAFANYRQRYVSDYEESEDEESGESGKPAIMGGWPYYQEWQGSYESAIAYMGYGKYTDGGGKYTNNTGYADIGGMPLSSGMTEGDLFMKEKVCSVSVETLPDYLYEVWHAVTGKINNEWDPAYYDDAHYEFSRTWFDLAGFRTELSCGEITVDNDTSPFPHRFTKLKPGTHDVNITKKAGATPEYSLRRRVWVYEGNYYGLPSWEGTDVGFYDFPAPGILPTEFPSDYCSTPDTVWPCGEMDIDIEVRAEELERGAPEDLEEHVYYFVELDGNTGEGEYRCYKDSEHYTLNDRFYGWSTDIIPNKLFSAWHLGWQYGIAYPNYIPVTLYFYIPARYDPDKLPEQVIIPSKWFEMTYDPSTGTGGPTIYIGGPKNNVREGLGNAPNIIRPFKAIIKAKNYYTGEDITGISFVNDVAGQVFSSGNEYDNQIYLRETFSNDDINVGDKNLIFHQASFERDFTGDNRTVTLTLYMVPNIGLDLTVKDNNDNPVQGATVQLRSAKGLDELLKTDDINGMVEVKNLKDECYTLIIDAAGCNTYTYELTADMLQPDGTGWMIFTHEAQLTPLTRPEVSDESFNRFGGFLPNVSRMKAQDTYELVTGDTPAGEALTMTVEAALKQQKQGDVFDKVVGVYIVDAKKFEINDKSREGEYTEITELPNPEHPVTVKKWLNDLNNRSTGLENVFFKYFDAESITQRDGDSGMADFKGEIMLYNLPAGPFKPVFIVVTEKGAYDVYAPEIEEDKQLVGLRKSGLLSFFLTVADMYAVAQTGPAVPLHFILPLLELTPALSEAGEMLEFDASIDMDDYNRGYLKYEYSLGVNCDAGTANPGGSPGSATSYLPAELSLEAGGSVTTSVSGKDLSIEDKFTGNVGAGADTDKYLPAFVKDIATMEIKAMGSVFSSSATEYKNDAEVKSFTNSIGVTGELETKTNISAVGAAGKFIGGGILAPVFRVIKKLGIDLGACIDANVGIGATVGYNENAYADGGNLNLINADIDFGAAAKLGLYGNICGGKYGGARGTLGFGGSHSNFQSSMMTLTLKFVYDAKEKEFRIEPAELTGMCEGEVEAFLKTAVKDFNIKWYFPVFAINMQFGTETKFTLTPIGKVYREIDRETFGTSTFMADETTGIMVKDYLSLATYATDENSGNILYTDLASQGGDMRLQLSKFNGTTWQQPVTILTTDGTLGSYDLLTLPNGKILITYNLISKEHMNSMFPDSQTKYTLGTIGANGWVEEATGTIEQLAGSYAFSCDLAGSYLVCRLTGGTGAEGFKIVGYKWNGAGFGAVQVLKYAATYDMSVAATDNELVVTYIDGLKKLQAISWTGDVANTTVAEDVGLVLAMTSDANGYYLVYENGGSVDFYTRGINPSSVWTKKGTPVSNVSAIEMDLAVNGDKLVLSFIKPSEAHFDTDNKLVVGNEGIASVTLAKDGTLYDEQRTYLENSQFYRNLSIVCVNGLAYAFVEDLYEDTADLVFVKIYDADAPVNFFGRVTITGTERFNERLTAAVSEDNSVTKNFTYTWKRDGVEIATGATYTTVAADIGKTLICEVTTDDHQGVIRKATGVIAKAAGPAAPAGLVGVAPTVAGGNDGKITGTNQTMEFSQTAAGVYTACRGVEITGLTAGTYYVRIAGNNTTEAGAYRTVTVGAGAQQPDNPPIPDDPVMPDAGTGQDTSKTIPTTDGKAQVDYVQSEEVVSLDISTDKAEEIISKSKDGDVGFDLSGVKDAKSVEMSKEALETFGKADVSVTVKLPEGSVTMDKEAVDSIAEQAGGDTVSVELALVKPEELNYLQEQSVGADDLIIDANITGGDGKKISTFNGELIMRIPYNGPLPVAVWYLNDAGELEKIDCDYENGIVTFRLNHLSVYILGQDVSRERDWTNPFTDVNKNAWYYSAIEYINKNKLMYGVGDNQFDPHGHMVRAMIVTVLHRLEKMPEPKAYNTFGDVAANRYYSKAVNWAAENGIVNGYGDGNFGPNDPVTREQLAVIFMNYAKYKGYDTSKRAALETFADAKSISGWATDAMAWANAEALILGDGTGLNPSGKGERCHAAAIFQRFIANIR